MMLSILFVLTLAPAVALEGPTLEEQAVEAANIWLSLLDDKNHTQAWLTASKGLKTNVSRKQLDDSLNALRSPLGELQLRELKKVEYTRSLPQGIKGEFIVIQYRGDYLNSTVTETIVTAKDVDGQWRVESYFIK